MRNKSVVKTAAVALRAARSWAWFPAAGLVALIVFAVASPGLLRSVTFTIVSLGAAITGALAIRRWRAPVRGLVAALTLCAISDVVWYVLSAVPGLVAYRDLSRAGYLAGLATAAVGTLRLLRLRTPEGDREGFVDGAIVATAVALVLWHPTVAQAGVGDFKAATIGAFALLVAAIAGMAFRLLFTDIVRLPSTWLLFAALVLLAAGALSGIMLPAVKSAAVGLLIDSSYLAAYVCAGTALLHPSGVGLGDSSPSLVAGLPLARLVAFGAALLVAPVLAYSSLEFTALRAVEAVAGLVLVALVMRRLVGLLYERETARRELHALADQQTTVARLGHLALADPDLPRLLEQTAAEVVRTLGCEACEVLGVRTGRVEDLPGVEVAVGEGGVLRAVTTEDHEWTDGERTFLQAVAHLLASAIERRRQEDEVHRLALHDPLTGLPNRILLIDRLRQAVAAARREGGRVSVLFCDLDGFKHVNDTFGHAAGDTVLVALAERMRQQVRASDTLARFAGDEFIIVVPGAADPADLAERVAAALRHPIKVRRGDGVADAHVGVSIGIATAAGIEADPDLLLHDADAAMYRRKQERRVAAG